MGTGNATKAVYTRILSERDVVKLRRDGNKLDLDLSYLFWKHAMAGVHRSIGIHIDGLTDMLVKNKLLGNDKTTIPEIKKNVIKEFCNKCVVNYESCSNLHCAVNYNW